MRYPASFRKVLERLSRRGRCHVSRIINKIGKIARFHRTPINLCAWSLNFAAAQMATVDQLNKCLPPSFMKLKAHPGEV